MALFQYEKHAQTVTYQALSLHNENKRYVSLDNCFYYIPFNKQLIRIALPTERFLYLSEMADIF